MIECQRRAIVAAANNQTATVLYELCAFAAAAIALASKVVERLERGKGALLIGLVAFALGALQGCAVELGPVPGARPAMESYATELTTAIDTWIEVYDLGTANPYELDVVIADVPLFEHLCERPAETATGCTGGDRLHLLVIDATDPDEIRNSVTHEAMHWLSWYSHDVASNNPEHDDPLIWGEGGILERTNNALGLPHD